MLCSKAKEGKSSESFSTKVYVIPCVEKLVLVGSTTFPKAVGVSEPARTGGVREATPFPVL